MKRLGEERDELASEVRGIRERLASQEGELAKLRRKDKVRRVDLDSLLERAVAFFKPK